MKIFRDICNAIREIAGRRKDRKILQERLDQVCNSGVLLLPPESAENLEKLRERLTENKSTYFSGAPRITDRPSDFRGTHKRS